MADTAQAPSADQVTAWQQAYKPLAAAAVADLLATVQAEHERQADRAA